MDCSCGTSALSPARKRNLGSRVSRRAWRRLDHQGDQATGSAGPLQQEDEELLKKLEESATSLEADLHCFLQEPKRDAEQLSRFNALMALKLESRMKGGSQRVLMIVESRAADHVMPCSELAQAPVVEGKCSKAGVHYTAADGGSHTKLRRATAITRDQNGAKG